MQLYAVLCMYDSWYEVCESHRSEVNVQISSLVVDVEYCSVLFWCDGICGLAKKQHRTL